MKKRIPAIILMFALFLTTSYAANTYRKTITVTSGVNVEFNNEAIDMTDANGKAVEAFIYNGTTYVPIRAVSNAFGADIDYEAAVGGVRVAKEHLRDNEKIPKDERTAKDDDALVSLQLENEMLQRGCEFLPIELGRSYASKYVVEDGKVRLPFTAIRGLGDAAAVALEQATMHGQEYISVEELQQASGVAQSVFDKLRAVGALGGLPETSQVDLFSMI